MDLADTFLSNLSFPDALRKQVLKLIEATRYGHRPKTRLEAMLIDADRANMGTRDFCNVANCSDTNGNTTSKKHINTKIGSTTSYNTWKKPLFNPKPPKNFGENNAKKTSKPLKKPWGNWANPFGPKCPKALW